MVLILVQKKIEFVLKQDKVFQVTPDIDESDIHSVVNYLESGGWLTEHKITNDLENKIASYVNRDYANAVPNGTIAIYLALISAGVKSGDRVAVPNLTMIATINSVIWAGAEPVIVDVDENLCMSYHELSQLEDIDAVIFVPLNGRTGDGYKIEKWCLENNILLIEDSAHALGSSYPHKACGSLGDLSIFSFTPHKIITMGQGGMILTDNEEYHEKIVELKTFNREQDKLDWHKGFGLNFKITDLQASIGISQFAKLEKYIENKRINWQQYNSLIESEDIIFLDFKNNETPWFFDVIFRSVEEKNNIIESLRKNNIETRNSYPALSLQNYLEKYKKIELTYSESISDRILWLPSSNNLKSADITKIANIINSSI